MAAKEAPVGHLDVLKLSTLLQEAKYLKVTNDARSPPPVLHLEIFSAMRSLELHETPVSMLSHLTCFPRQLEVLRYHNGRLGSPVDLLLTKSWPCLHSLTITASHLHTWPTDLDMHVPALVLLDCSQNDLTAVGDLAAPTTLLSAAFSHNAIATFALRATYSTLTTLLLDHNSLTSVDALVPARLPVLAVLDVSCNRLTDVAAVSRLAALPLTELHLHGNPLAAVPDYRRQVLFHVGPGVELDAAPWTEVELASMRFRRRQVLAGATDAFGYPVLAPQAQRLPPRRAAIEEPFVLPPKAPAAKGRGRVESAWSDNSVVSSVDDFVLVTPTHRGRAESYYVDEFLRDLAAEEDDDTDDADVATDTEAYIAPGPTSGVDVRLYLSPEDAEAADLAAGQEGLPAIVHVHASKVVEELPSGHVLSRPLASLMCVAVAPATAGANLLKLGFRHLPSVAYELAAAAVGDVLQPLQRLLCRKPVVGVQCLGCQAFVLLREGSKRAASVLQVRRCWICRSANVRECPLGPRLASWGCRLDDGHRPLREENQAGFVLAPEFDEEAQEDAVVLVVTETWMKEVKLAWQDDEEAAVETWRQLCRAAM
ncbi:hypothetical protein ACHHYP_12593 [Achlya hypogyna]|uniref:Uncharacterized protein n=1 Tax=Achlya hypogyna TaxID=1202772 RepID=A0A1V9YGN6_ACHHY|nr:hypothetical protein ACHHYP_12593 [Achlya hypogyna]